MLVLHYFPPWWYVLRYQMKLTKVVLLAFLLATCVKKGFFLRSGMSGTLQYESIHSTLKHLCSSMPTSTTSRRTTAITTLQGVGSSGQARGGNSDCDIENDSDSHDDSSSSGSAISPYFHSKKVFEECGLNANVMGGVLRQLTLERPSKIQALAFREVYTGTNCIIADQTGSGKTLSYLLPLMQRIIELQKEKVISSPESRAPYIVVITPTTELALQVSKVVKSLANVLKFRTSCVTSISDMDAEQKKLRLGVEILVSTPGRIISLMDKQEISFHRCQAIVLDEADVLFMDESFPLQPIGLAAPEDTQFIFVTATLPEIVTEQINREFPDVKPLKGPGLHRINPSVNEILVDCSAPRNTRGDVIEIAIKNKALALLKTLEQENSERTIIFCNTINQCREVENALARADRSGTLRLVLPYHGAIDAMSRERNIGEFSRQLLKLPVVLVCTDRASRGLDFERAHVDHVVLYDFPQEPSEYVRRVGRTGRAGRSGLATVLVSGRQVGIAKKVIGASIAGNRIEPVPELSNLESWKRKVDNN